jgi:hypothetical protein
VCVGLWVPHLLSFGVFFASTHVIPIATVVFLSNPHLARQLGTGGGSIGRSPHSCVSSSHLGCANPPRTLEGGGGGSNNQVHTETAPRWVRCWERQKGICSNWRHTTLSSSSYRPTNVPNRTVAFSTEVSREARATANKGNLQLQARCALATPLCNFGLDR